MNLRPLSASACEKLRARQAGRRDCKIDPAYPFRKRPAGNRTFLRVECGAGLQNHFANAVRLDEVSLKP
jgi:hypothetical protein